jgi:hypothetical protein
LKKVEKVEGVERVEEVEEVVTSKLHTASLEPHTGYAVRQKPLFHNDFDAIHTKKLTLLFQ